MFDYNKEIKDCTNCENGRYLEGIDYHIPRDTIICERKKCKHYGSLKEIVENNSSRSLTDKEVKIILNLETMSHIVGY